MARKRIKDYAEPWTVDRDTTWATGFRNPPVESEYVDADAVAKWHAAKATAEERAPWFMWGSRMGPVAITESLMGKLCVWDGRGIIGWTRNMPAGVTHEEMALRVRDCVNAMRAVGDPVALVADLRGLLLDMLKGQSGPDDPRILSCVARMIPAEELASHEEEP